MKKLALTLVLGLVAWSASAQWGVGARVGTGFHAVGQYTFNNDNYLEARFGPNWANGRGLGVTADFSLLYNWNLANMNWTPNAGQWFFDLGAGLNVGGKSHYTYVGGQIVAKMGIELDRVPLRLSFDWAPVFGAEIAHAKVGGVKFKDSQFYKRGLLNLGVSCVYSF